MNKTHGGTNKCRLLLAAVCGFVLAGCQTVPGLSERPVAVVPQPAPVVETGNARAGEPLPQPLAEAVAPPAVPQRPPPADLWLRLRKRFALPDHDHPAVRPYTERYAGRKYHMARISKRAVPYLHLILEAVEARNLPGELALLPAIESGFRPYAHSRGRAAGLWQFVPATGRHYGLKQTWWYDGRRDVEAATNAALDYLQRLHRRFDGDWLVAIAAYNAGETRVARAMRENRRRGRPVDFWSLDLPGETKDYVPALLGLSNVVAEPERYGVRLHPIPDVPLLTGVEVGGQIDLGLVAELSGLSIREIYRYNPGFNRWATDPQGPHRLLLPEPNAAEFERKLGLVPANQRIRLVRHRVAAGETLTRIASRYHSSVAALRAFNELEGADLRKGDIVLVPMAKLAPGAYSLRTASPRPKPGPKRPPVVPAQGRKTIYLVQDGDTLWDIAQAQRVRVSNLAAWNGLDSGDILRPGQTLVVWHDHRPAVRLAKAKQSADRAVDADAIHYEVRKGDSLWRISRHFKVAVDDLLTWNALTRTSYLRPGQRLKLYRPAAAARRDPGNI